MIVAQAAGGAPDILARVLAEQLQAAWKQPVLVENRPGAAGAIAASYAAGQPADGYTLFVGSAGIMAIAPLLDPKLPYKVDDFVPLAHLASVSNVIVVPKASGVRTVAALVESGRKSAKGLSYATLGAGSTGQISAEMLLRQGSFSGVEVPYKGEAPAMSDLISGLLDFMAAAIPVALPHISSGRLEPLAVTGTRRVPLLPDTPTMAEAGFKDYEVSQWYALYAPAKTPREVTDQITRAVREALTKDAVQRRVGALAMESTTEKQRDFPGFEKSERRKWHDFMSTAKPASTAK
jgi:tripartite-type tricarboxylate transporter receptor subunit TctC